MSTANFDERTSQINDKPLFSSKELRKISDDMKNDLEIMIKSMGDAIKSSMEEKTKAFALKELVIEKENEVQKALDEITSIDERIIKNEVMITEMEKELNALKNAIEGIKEITSDLDPLDAERAVGSLKGTLIKKQSDLEKLRGGLNSSKKLRDLATKRLIETRNSLIETEKHYSGQISSAEVLAENVEESISHIVKTYNDVVSIAKELLIENLDTQHIGTSHFIEKIDTGTTNTEAKFFTTEKENNRTDEEPLAS